MKENAFPLRWSADGVRIFLLTETQPRSIWSIATVGGEPEPLMTQPERGTSNKRAVAIAPDGRTVAAFQSLADGYTVWITSPLESEPTKYTPDPFVSTTAINVPTLKFSPDGKHLLLIVNGGRVGEEVWLLDYPPSGANGVRRVLPELRTFGGTPDFDWMPDNRRVVLALQTAPDAAVQLWMADTCRARVTRSRAGRAAAAVPRCPRTGSDCSWPTTSAITTSSRWISRRPFPAS